MADDQTPEQDPKPTYKEETERTKKAETGQVAPSDAEPGEGVRLKREEYDKMVAAMARLPELEGQTKKAEAMQKNLQVLLREDADPEDSAKAMVGLLTSVGGYSEEEAREYVEAKLGGGKKGERAEDQLTKKLGELEERQRKTDHQQLARELDSRVGEVLKDNEKLETLMRFLDEDEGQSKARETLRREIRQETLARLQSRNKSQPGGFNLGWIQEETTKAADAVYDKFRSVIGDPSKLGRASETVTASDRFKS